MQISLIDQYSKFIIDGESNAAEKSDVEMKPSSNASSNAPSAASSRKGSKKKMFSRLKSKVKRTASDPMANQNRYFYATLAVLIEKILNFITFLVSVDFKQLSFYHFNIEISWLLRLLIKIIPQLGLKAPFYQENSFHEQQVHLMVVNLQHLHNHERAMQIVESCLVKVVQVQRYLG